MTTPRRVVAGRRHQRRRLLDEARAYAAGLHRPHGIAAVVVFGSVARGDFHDWSDVDVLVVAAELPDKAPDRLHALGALPPRVEVVAWTPAEWRAELARRNPIATEAVTDGVWLEGRPEDLEATPSH